MWSWWRRLCWTQQAWTYALTEWVFRFSFGVWEGFEWVYVLVKGAKKYLIIRSTHQYPIFPFLPGCISGLYNSPSLQPDGAIWLIVTSGICLEVIYVTSGSKQLKAGVLSPSSLSHPSPLPLYIDQIEMSPEKPAKAEALRWKEAGYLDESNWVDGSDRASLWGRNQKEASRVGVVESQRPCWESEIWVKSKVSSGRADVWTRAGMFGVKALGQEYACEFRGQQSSQSGGAV